MADLHADVEVAAGSLLGPGADFVLEHAWTDAGAGVTAEGTGAHLLLVGVGLCVLNDVYREARPGIQVDGVRVRVAGELDAESWSTTAISYEVDIDSPEDDAAVARLLEQVDAVAEIPRALRGEVKVERR